MYSLSYMMHPTFLKVRNHFAMDFSKVSRSVIRGESLQDTLESYQCCLFLFVCNSIQPFGVLECCTSSSVRSENLDLISLNAFIKPVFLISATVPSWLPVKKPHHFEIANDKPIICSIVTLFFNNKNSTEIFLFFGQKLRRLKYS